MARTLPALLLIGWLGVLILPLPGEPRGPVCAGPVSVVAGVTRHHAFPLHDPQPFRLAGALRFHPVVVGFAGLADLRDDDERGARAAAANLLAHAEPDGRLPYGFAWDEMRPPWYSGMAQGLALSLFSRLGMREAADATYATLPTFTRPDGWIEEYPGQSPILNGHIFAAFGLYDYWSLSGRGETELRAAMQVVADNLHRFLDRSGRVRYALDDSRYFPDYDAAHAAQLEALAAMSGLPCLAR